MTLWDKGYETSKKVTEFTVGNDYLLDLALVKYDCIASKAHASMLEKQKLISKEELKKLIVVLDEIIELAKNNKFIIKKEQEDCHTAIEDYLTKKLGSIGEKIHTARSRNDQVLAAVRLYEKAKIKEVIDLIGDFNESITIIVKKFGSIEIPGYTHTRKAMPTSIKDWAESFIAAMNDDKKLLLSIKKIIDQSPLGSAAGFGVPILNIDKAFTAKKANFSKEMSNPVYAQLSRGKFESMIINALTQVMLTLNKLSTDIILFSASQLGYIELPKEYCTGSSIMPQKKNPDVFELIRGYYHVLVGEQVKIQSMISNLISGYHRDLQLTKEPVMKSFNITKECLEIASIIIKEIKVDEKKCAEAMTKELYATEEAYKLVKKGLPFRQAYKEVGKKFN